MTLEELKIAVREELLNNILPFWSSRMVDIENGGFYGRINGDCQLMADADKGGILNARILWTFSAAYNHLRNPLYLEMAGRAKSFILENFIDKKYGGTYWMVSCKGNPVETKKQIYSQAFFIYAFAEHYLASGEETSFSTAKELFRQIEEYSFDKERNGYYEAFSRDWKLLEDLRLSEKDANEKKTMNTHLHILEAYTSLYRIWKNEELRKQLHNLIEVFAEKIINTRTRHLNLFFDENWTVRSPLVSYGHDIEASWLIIEASEVLGDRELLSAVQPLCTDMAEAACEGLENDGSLIYEMDPVSGHIDRSRHWWVQSEAVVGFYNAYEISGKSVWLDRTFEVWRYISENLIDRKNGEWFWSVSDDRIPNRKDDKAGFWKCPYHNSRMCLEIMKRINNK